VGRTAGADPEVRLGESAGTVVVTARVEASPDEAWSALTEPERVEQWFGDLSGELSPGATVRLGFGDGDFFDLEVEEVAEPVLRWSWRFMGCGPRNAIEVRVEGHDRTSVVTVEDREPGRSRDDALELGEGWRDFTSRLQRYLATGRRSRYEWRSDVDVWVELPLDADAARRLVIGSAADLLPLEAGAANLLTAGALVLDDGEQPARFAIGGVAGTGPASVRFDLRPDGIEGSLATSIGIAGRDSGAKLAIAQTGFRDLPAGESTQRRLRERFAAAWLAVAHRAADLAQRAPEEAVT
jgi:uncharacterized protein YndB with AHSA1/START domain